MRVYLDTGIFIDYLSARGHAGLRTAGRRGRSLTQLSTDAEQLLERLSRRHQAATSCLTYYEVEEVLYKQLYAGARGVSKAQKLLVPAARYIVVQTQMVVKAFKIAVLDLTSRTVDLQLQTIKLQAEGVRAADALHIATAVDFGAELVVSADDQILGLHEGLTTATGKLKCLDAHAALQIL